MEELNKKLAEWAGFKKARRCGDGETIYYPPNMSVFAATCEDCNFTHSLNACFEWLVPKLTQLDINAKISLDYQVTCNVGIYFSNPADDDFPTKQVAYGVEKTPALALCKAIEQLIDG